MPTSSDIFESAIPQAEFPKTHWSEVLSASDPSSTRGAEALEKLCRTYWYPLYVFVRRRGKSAADAQDLTQEFFARLLARHWLERADQAQGRFRTFLLHALERFLANEWDKLRALKRGGGQKLVPLQFETGETRYSAEPADLRTPEQVFERRWALALLGEVMKRLEAEYQQEGKTELFAALQPCLVGDRETLPYAELARQLDQNEGTVRVAVHRLRQRYRELLRAEIAHTVASADEVDAEMHHLFKVLAQGGP
jgi:RNA polymerase sigma-70 factor (ECF subfamily)